jgi:hypothetical protein
MSDDQFEPGVGSPVAPIAIESRRETASQAILLALLLIDFGLAYILYRQLDGHKGDFTASEIIINLGILFLMLIIAVSAIQIAIRRFKYPTVTIPSEDRRLLEQLILDEKTTAIELYVRLASLGGPTGTATKLGLTGLPLATIALTIFFPSSPCLCRLFSIWQSLP